MNLIRKYKISKVLNQPLKGIDKEVIDFIEDWIIGLTPFNFSLQPKSVFYMTPAGKWVIEYDFNAKHVYVRYADFWRVIEERYSFNYVEIQTLLKFIITKHYKFEIREITFLSLIAHVDDVEDEYNKLRNELSQEV